tara:strand:- start:152 stop:529 length:378 start_codon:yes stop_codon:yes gene_type:complete
MLRNFALSMYALGTIYANSDLQSIGKFYQQNKIRGIPVTVNYSNNSLDLILNRKFDSLGIKLENNGNYEVRILADGSLKSRGKTALTTQNVETVANENLSRRNHLNDIVTLFQAFVAHGTPGFPR